MTARFAIPNRLAPLTEIGLDLVAAAAGSDPEVLRLENLDTDLPIPPAALQEGAASLSADDNNSWLPLNGRIELREALSRRLHRQTGQAHDPSDIVVTCGGLEGVLDTLLATTVPGDEVLVTDPTYAGMINRIRLVGAVPAFVPLIRRDGPAAEWRLDQQRLSEAVTQRTRALFIMNPSMPSGAVLNHEEWASIARVCCENDVWLIYNAAMENILYDHREYFHPASLPGMAERTITVGSASKEFRMIGWKVGWVAGPGEIMADIAKAHVYNTACPVGISQTAVAAALESNSDDLRRHIDEWQSRRDFIVDALGDEYAIIPAAGGWSMLLDVGRLGLSSVEASRRLLKAGKVAATYMRDWGRQNSDQFVRIVFSNEPLGRLRDIRSRFDRALL